MLNAGSLRIAGAEFSASERRALRQGRQAQRSGIVALRTNKAHAATLLRQSSVDQLAVLAELDRARAADIMVRATVERSAVLFAVRSLAADRAKLADAAKRRARRRAPAAK